MINLFVDKNDNQEFTSKLTRFIINYSVKINPTEVFIIRVDNWFDKKWLNFSGTVMHEVSVWDSDEISVPPFHPNRILKTTKYNFHNGIFEEVDENVELHIFQSSSNNLKRKFKSICKNGLFIWYSSNSEVNGVGAVMVYKVNEQEVNNFYFSLAKQNEWEPKKVLGNNLSYVEDLLK